MEDHDKTKEQLLRELAELRRQIRDKPARPIDAVEFAGDVSERKRVEDSLRESEARFRNLIENMPDFVLVVDRDAKIEFTNRTPREATPRQLIGTIGSSHIAPEYVQDCRDALQQAFATGEAQAVEARTKYGGWWDCRLVPFADPAGRLVMIICADITERKAAEDMLRKEQQQLRRLLEMHERDRKLVACEIHDGLVQPLIGAKMILESEWKAFREQHPGLIWDGCERGLDMLESSINDARRMISGQRPMILDEMGLLPALDHLVNENQGDGSPVIAYTHHVQFGRLASSLETAIFRIVQEGLVNALHHGNGSTISIKIAQHDDRVRVEIEDSGVGFDPKQVEAGHFGLEGIRQRARSFDGLADIDSAPGKGTRIKVELPLMHDTPT